MKWLELSIDTSHAGIGPVSDMLSSVGIDDIVVNDGDDFEDFLENNRKYWDYVDEDLRREKAGKYSVDFYLADGEEGWALLGRVRIAMERLKAGRSDLGPMIMTMKNVADEDWENNWKQYYKPIEIGKRLIVIPEWEKAETGGRVPLILNPGLAFGTGSHATTRLCLERLDALISGGERVLDLGCGSGILSIAALRLGAREAFACDIDEKAADIAYENAALNGIGKDVYTVLAGDILTDDALRGKIGVGYDVVLANIVADVIIALAPSVRALLAPGGTFICSGIIDTRAAEVAEKLRAAGLEITETDALAGWYCYTAK
jgi:ribosomal protein L11 methyltransferase